MNNIIDKIIEILKINGIKKLCSKTKLNYRQGQIIMSSDRQCRYYYSENLDNQNSNKKITILMFNPSKADINKPDRTINNIYKIIKTYTDYSKFEIFNIYNIRNENPSCDKENCINKNLKLLTSMLDISSLEDSDILIAWGNLLSKMDIDYIKNNKKFNEVLSKKKIYVVALTKTKQPMHLSPQNNRYINKNLIQNKGLKPITWNEIKLNL